MNVKLTQFLRPNGRQQDVTCEISDSLRGKYDDIVACGARLTCEVLMTGQVSISVEHPEGDFDILIAPNAPGLPHLAVSQIVERFDIKKFKRFLRAVRQ